MQHIYMHISSPLLVLRNLGFVEPQAQLRSRRHGQISQGDEAEGEIGLTATKTQWLISLSLSLWLNSLQKSITVNRCTVHVQAKSICFSLAAPIFSMKFRSEEQNLTLNPETLVRLPDGF